MNDSQTASRPASSDRSPAAIKVDNVLRRTLKISDPYDSTQVAGALLSRYADDAEAIRREATGLPVVRMLPPVVRADGSGPVRGEVRQARDDLERDLDALVSNSQLKDTRAELRGWSTAIRNAVAEGLDSGHFALDPVMRARAFAARRLLGDYARLARYVGALSGGLNPLYRRLAQSCDVVASLVLVLLGDGLAEGGVTRGTFLLQAPASELRERRDAALNALRNLIGSTQDAYGPNDWPRGIEAYRQILRRIDQAGHSDLRALFNESSLARIFDELIDLAASSNADSLRALGSTALISVQRLRRLVIVGSRLTYPASPPLSALLSAISLFIQGFENAQAGSRLLFVARPPIVVYGLYGLGGPDAATDRLIDITIARGRLAELLDCYLDCDCDSDSITCQVLLDKLLYDVDRAIDLYCLGTDPNGLGEPEQRAASYGKLIETFLTQYQSPDAGSDALVTTCIEQPSEIGVVLTELSETLLAAAPVPLIPENIRNMRSELCLQRDGEGHFESLISAIAPSCHLSSVFGWEERSVEGSDESDGDENGPPPRVYVSCVRNLINATLVEIGDRGDNCPFADVAIPPHFETSFDEFVNDQDGRGSSEP